jgi:hypothetical protein
VVEGQKAKPAAAGSLRRASRSFALARPEPRSSPPARLSCSESNSSPEPCFCQGRSSLLEPVTLVLDEAGLWRRRDL